MYVFTKRFRTFFNKSGETAPENIAAKRFVKRPVKRFIKRFAKRLAKHSVKRPVKRSAKRPAKRFAKHCAEAPDKKRCGNFMPQTGGALILPALKIHAARFFANSVEKRPKNCFFLPL